MANTFLDLAVEVLKDAPKPLTYQEIWELAERNGLSKKLQTKGKTPWQSLGSRVYVDVRDNAESKIRKIGKRPTRFFLKVREHELPTDIVGQLEKEDAKREKIEAKKGGSQAAYHERELHALLAYFAYANPGFNRGRSLFTKTIFHEKSTRSGYNEWLHPDMVGFYMPLDDWRPHVIEFNRLSDNNALRLFSFEVKKSLTKGNYRESYFQAVSNSSWAHEGYLVAAEVLQEDDFLAELERLASSFGVGIIHLNPHDIDASVILYPASTRESLDWEMINKLCEQNSDFEKFLQDVKIDFEGKRVHRSEYDVIEPDINSYIRTRLKIDPAE